ncbi:hypothetical protein KI387_007637, partial [Taxus chinensis]
NAASWAFAAQLFFNHTDRKRKNDLHTLKLNKNTNRLHINCLTKFFNRMKPKFSNVLFSTPTI